MTNEAKNIILKIIKNNMAATDYDIASNPKVKKCFKDLKYDSVRRTINLLRKEYNLCNPNTENKKKIDKDIPIYLKKYKDSTIHQIASQLKLKYPFYKFNTIRLYVTQYIHWQQ
jgi:hypothetical protein